MMRNSQLLVAVLVSTGLVFADSAPSVYNSTADSQSKTQKVMVLRVQDVFEKSKRARLIQEKVEAEVNKKISEIRSMEKPFTEKAEKLQRDGRNMTQDKREALEGELASMKIQIEIKQRGVQTYVQEQTEKAEKELIGEIQKVCEKLGYDVVIPGALYVRPGIGVDCTDAVVKKMDEGMATESMTKKLASEVNNVKNK